MTFQKGDHLCHLPIYQSSSKYAINDLVKEMDSLWKSMLNNIAEVLNAPAVGLILTSKVGFQNIAMSSSPGVKANPEKSSLETSICTQRKVMETKAMSLCTKCFR
ncbi:hypothetical protein O9993_08610 [Vibrio lentus]|nr:hypothetical protein [Vibrio lentus]